MQTKTVKVCVILRQKLEKRTNKLIATTDNRTNKPLFAGGRYACSCTDVFRHK